MQARALAANASTQLRPRTIAWSAQLEAVQSNAVLAQELESTGPGSAEGLSNYQQTLGSWLGTELYEAVSKEISLDRMASHADKALTGAMRSAAL